MASQVKRMGTQAVPACPQSLVFLIQRQDGKVSAKPVQDEPWIQTQKSVKTELERGVVCCKKLETPLQFEQV